MWGRGGGGWGGGGGRPAWGGAPARGVPAGAGAHAGIAAGLFNTAERVGSGLGVTGVLLLADVVARQSTAADAYRTGLNVAFAAAAALAVIGAVLTVALLRTSTAPAAEPKSEIAVHE